MSEPEIPLTGGNVNADVVRVGNTVRRQQTKHSPTIHRFLEHLENVGFVNAPRFLGIDAQGREILSFINGDGPPATLWNDESVLIAAAQLLRAFHNASQSFDQTDTDTWAYSHPDVHEVICHNDFAPYDMVFTGDIPTGVIDFDLCGPGPRLRDVAYLAYWMVPLSFQAKDMKPHAQRDLLNNSARLKLLCKTYGIPCDVALLKMVSTVLHHMADASATSAMIGDLATQPPASRGPSEPLVR